jgi:hypothetical protein
MPRSTPLLLLVALLVGCAPGVDHPAPDPTTPVPAVELERLAAWMTGSFSSAEQSRRDEDYHDIRLEMVRIWHDRTDGIWLYVEQAAANRLQEPYRQRVYRLTQLGPDLFESRVFSLEDPLRHAGVWREPEPLSDLEPAALVPRHGCAVLLRLQPDGSYAGSTLGSLCQSSLRGASCATSEVRVTADEIRSWDRGFDAAGRQVWGAQKGPYLFRKLADSASE